MRRDVVAYTYRDELCCWDCMFAVACAEVLELGDATIWGDCYQTESVVGSWALLLGIDRDDETSFDDQDLPKVIVAGSEGLYDVDGPKDSDGAPKPHRCATCREPLVS